VDLAEVIASDEFAQRARHPYFPNAFTRNRKLPLPTLIAALLSMRASSQQVMLDSFFGNLSAEGQLTREVSDRAFAKARERLYQPALTWLNDWVLTRADAIGLVPLWHGLRLVAGDGSVLMPAVRASHRTRTLAPDDQRLFALYLPAAELTLHASVHSASESERAMLVEALDKLGPNDVLLLDRGYPAGWLVNLLNERGIRFIMRCDNDSGWRAVRDFMLTTDAEASVQLNTPSAQDVQDWQCGPHAPTVRLVRNISPNSQVRVLATNLPAQEVPAHAFSDLYHERWRIEESFKRLKKRMHLEAVSGLTQQSLIIDVAAKVLADNIASLMCAAAAEDDAHMDEAPTIDNFLDPSPPQDTGLDPLPQQDVVTIPTVNSPSGKTNEPTNRPSPYRKCNRTYAANLLQRLLPKVLLAVGDVLAAITNALDLLARTTQRFIPGRSQPRPKHHVKPHPKLAYKG
jgi:hypothetical protein